MFYKGFVIEWIENRKDYRVYRPEEPKNTCAYVDSIEEAKEGINDNLWRYEKMVTIETIIAYLEENEEEFNELIEDLDCWNGYLNDDRYYPMDELNEFYRETEPIELLYRAFYGHDEETCTIDEHGEKHYGEFNPNREYFRYNGYGNLVSADYKDYSDMLDDWFVEKVIENRSHLDISDDLSELLDEYENGHEEETEEE